MKVLSLNKYKGVVRRPQPTRLISFYLFVIGLNTWGVVIGLIAGFLYRKVVNNGGL